MNYQDSMEKLEKEGFSWQYFRDYFPFGDDSLGEGNYYRLVEKAIDALPTPEEKQLLLDLLDTQACVYLEQIWVLNEQLNDNNVFVGYGCLVSTWLQIHSNIRNERNLPTKNARSLMMNLGKGEMLIDLMMA